MRTDERTIVRLLLPCTAAIAALCAWDPTFTVQAFAQTAPTLAVPATALGLTLITAASQNRQ